MSGVIGAKDSACFTHKNSFINKKIMCMKSLCVRLFETWKLHERVCQNKPGQHQVKSGFLNWNSGHLAN
jgi:hypothetical protein